MTLIGLYFIWSQLQQTSASDSNFYGFKIEKREPVGGTDRTYKIEGTYKNPPGKNQELILVHRNYGREENWFPNIETIKIDKDERKWSIMFKQGGNGTHVIYVVIDGNTAKALMLYYRQVGKIRKEEDDKGGIPVQGPLGNDFIECDKTEVTVPIKWNNN